jgi:hypothetical protein
MALGEEQCILTGCDNAGKPRTTVIRAASRVSSARFRTISS